nr:unnamed protein product [Digitaria exilis]
MDGGIPTRAEGGEHRRAGRRRLISSRRALASERAERRGKWRGDRVRIPDLDADAAEGELACVGSRAASVRAGEGWTGGGGTAACGG